MCTNFQLLQMGLRMSAAATRRDVSIAGQTPLQLCSLPVFAQLLLVRRRCTNCGEFDSHNDQGAVSVCGNTSICLSVT